MTCRLCRARYAHLPDFLSLCVVCMPACLALHYMLTKLSRYSKCQADVTTHLSCVGATYVYVPACLLHHLLVRCCHVMHLHMIQVFSAAFQALNTLTRVGVRVSESLLSAKLFKSACFVVELLYKSDTHYTPKYILVWWSGLATFSVRCL
jgi:hypothetical protein